MTVHADSVRTVIRSRRSIRKFAEGAISREDLDDLILAGIYAPSGSNSQNQRFLIVDDTAEVGRIRYSLPYPSGEKRDRHPEGIIGNAAVLIAVFADTGRTAPKNTGEYYVWEVLDVQNGAAAIQNILLMATAKGIASCWVSATENMNYTRLLSGKTWRDAFRDYDVPAGYKIQGIVLLGRPTRTDTEGVPLGTEPKHGVLWEPVERRDITHYLIHPASATAPAAVPPAGARMLLAFCSGVIHALLRLVALLDRTIFRLEHRTPRR